MSEIVVFNYPSSTSGRKTTALLNELGINFKERHIVTERPTKEELIEMLKLTKEGTEEITARKSSTNKAILEQQLDLKLSDFLEMLLNSPRLLKVPIVVAGQRLICGYKKSDLEQLRGIE